MQSNCKLKKKIISQIYNYSVYCFLINLKNTSQLEKKPQEPFKKFYMCLLEIQTDNIQVVFMYKITYSKGINEAWLPFFRILVNIVSSTPLLLILLAFLRPLLLTLAVEMNPQKYFAQEKFWNRMLSKLFCECGYKKINQAGFLERTLL